MSNVTRPPVGLISARRKGNVISEGSSLTVEDISGNGSSSTLDGFYDRTTGVLTINIPNQPTLMISGFLTEANLPSSSGTTSKGDRGRDGIDGMIGLDGGRGDQGCMGPEGKRGATGRPGPRGRQGIQGETGATGATGATGQDGRVLVFTQKEDPGPVGAFAIWLKPTN